MKIKECIVVEGRDDTVAIKRAVDAETIETIGSSVPKYVIEQIKLADERRGIIVLTDPDYPGERIRRIVTEAVPSAKHAFIPKHLAISANKKSVGVEHASPEVIREALQNVRDGSVLDEYDPVLLEDIHAVGLMAGTEARKRRELIGNELRIGYANGKQFLKRMHKFRISKREFYDAVKKVGLK
ncbi:ribonuclease M5 [Geomicrobium sp. JCM 19055]|uniref:ribonuclease M5 n=1 Tax=Geomicrobium sp. JCM 19055 TaxID=1460649 RepID=UPI00045ED803|nr:ribonuclease M5 [Geomicrobium sp. JCM 19055]GAK01386.1 ribonuclease M5 [Geomicrobium sp. JCM 19055]